MSDAAGAPLPPVRILAAGGTFDKHYDPIAGQLSFSTTHLPALLDSARCAPPVRLEVAMLVDSLDMTDAHRQDLLARCRAATERAIVIVHGTDTMTDTAGVLGAARLPATIVLTGAMVPIEVAGSDGAFNLGFAMACAQLLPPGVWVAMNGTARPWDDVRKDRVRGVFEPMAPRPGSDDAQSIA